MCTAVLSIEPGHPVLLAGVRDELIDRAWQPPGRHWPGYPDLIGGRDLQAGGTWLAVAPASRRVACVLNGIGRPAPAQGRRSRGELPLAAAAGDLDDTSRKAPLRGVLDHTDPFRLLIAEPGRAVLRCWDGRELTTRELPAGLHLIVNSALASDLPGTSPGRAAAAGAAAAGRAAGADRAAGAGGRTLPDHASTGEPAEPRRAAPAGPPPPDGREHELARITHFLGRFAAAPRPDPRPGLPVRETWGSWFPLVNGDGIEAEDQRALIVRRDLSGGRTWGTTSISLVALGPDLIRYDFAAVAGSVPSWASIL